MQKYYLFFLSLFISAETFSQLPCSTPAHRQFDFWLGEWEAFATNGSKAGDSKVSLMLDSCTLLEEWTSTSVQNGLRYAGKSFNTFNATTGNWQQTWVDNTGRTNEYLKGSFTKNKMAFTSDPFPFIKDTMAIRRMTFTNLEDNTLRQHGEISKNNGQSFQTEYDLKYRRKVGDEVTAINATLRQMETDFNNGNFKNIATHYSVNGKVIGPGTAVSGTVALEKYWEGFSQVGGKWKLTTSNAEIINGQAWQKGISLITDKNGLEHKVSFTLLWGKEQGLWKILMDAYWP